MRVWAAAPFALGLALALAAMALTLTRPEPCGQVWLRVGESADLAEEGRLTLSALQVERGEDGAARRLESEVLIAERMPASAEPQRLNLRGLWPVRWHGWWIVAQPRDLFDGQGTGFLFLRGPRYWPLFAAAGVLLLLALVLDAVWPSPRAAGRSRRCRLLLAAALLLGWGVLFFLVLTGRYWGWLL